MTMEFDKQHRSGLTRRTLINTGLIGGVSAVGAAALLGIPGAWAKAAVKSAGKSADIAILNGALDLEHQGIWAYSAAGGKLSDTPVGKTILALALRNQNDHKRHRDILAATIKELGGTPSSAKEQYDLSSYMQAGEGNLDSDANIGKLALALEVDAAIAYGDAFSKLKDAGLIAAAATIAPDEAAHATAIRAVFRTLFPTVEFVPAPFVSAETRSQWILKV